MLGQRLAALRERSALVHNITNYVTVNDCANILLACGGSPIMSDEPEEVADITSICSTLNINIGTLNSKTIEAMYIAGKRAAECSHPIVLDPVGAGASPLRTQTALGLMNAVHFTVIRGNMSEIKALFAGDVKTKGVDADASDAITHDSIDEYVRFIKSCADSYDCIIAATGKTDIVSDGKKTYVIDNGTSMMSSVSGTGCMLSSTIAAFISANPENTTEAVAAAVCSMGVCGEIAKMRLSSDDGNASYRTYIIDAMYNLTPDTLEGMAKYEVR